MRYCKASNLFGDSRGPRWMPFWYVSKRRNPVWWCFRIGPWAWYNLRRRERRELTEVRRGLWRP